jgi:hypothetical protein
LWESVSGKTALEKELPKANFSQGFFAEAKKRLFKLITAFSIHWLKEVFLLLKWFLNSEGNLRG